MKVQTPQIAWHNRDRVSSVSIQPCSHPKPLKEFSRIATGGDDSHVVVSTTFYVKRLWLLEYKVFFDEIYGFSEKSEIQILNSMSF